jgi:hypothetical protein
VNVKRNMNMGCWRMRRLRRCGCGGSWCGFVCRSDGGVESEGGDVETGRDAENLNRREAMSAETGRDEVKKWEQKNENAVICRRAPFRRGQQ